MLLEAQEARRLTDDAKADAAAFWDKLLALYEGKAHEALKYASWGAYFEAESGRTTAAATNSWTHRVFVGC